VASNVAASISVLHLDVQNQCLWWGEQVIALTPKAFAVLHCLVDHSDRLVTKETLLKTVWRSAHVGEGQVKQFIAELRKILHDDPSSPRFIETVRGRGYRFIGDIALRGESPEVHASDALAQAPPIPPHRSSEGGERGDVNSHGQPSATWNSRPAMAVLPFQNLSGDPNDRYFGEGITEEIIDGFARSRSLLVIARLSTLPYRDRRTDAKQIAQELGVRYILDGTVRRQKSRLRISADLIDANQNRTIWAEKYDGANENVFEFQDRIASSIVATIEPRLFEAEMARVRNKPTDSLDAYDCVLRALSLLYTFDEGDLRKAGSYLDRAVALDPGYARAYAYKAWWHILSIYEARGQDPARHTALGEIAARRAIALDPMDAQVVAVAAHVQALLHRRPEDAAEMFDRSLQLNGNSAFAWGMSAATCCYLGQPDEALERLQNASRLSPFDPLNFVFWTTAGIAQFIAGHYDQAITWLKKARRLNPRFAACHRTLTTSLAHAGRDDEAKAAALDLLTLDPNFRITAFASRYPLRRAHDLERYTAGLRSAGLPD
jgi:adenylate cyclase